MILDKFRLDGRVAVITGGGRGIGAATALALAEAGADIAIAARTGSELDEVAGKVRALGRRAFTFPGNLAHTETLEAFAATAAADLGRIDIVVNNVGGTMPNTFLTTTSEELDQAFHFNVTTAHALTRAATPHLLAQGGGAVVNITSTLGRVPGRGYLAYGTAKAALAHWTRMAATDLSPRIRVNAIAVGSTLTSALDVVAQQPELKKQMEDATPLRRLGEPWEIAAAIVYLCSPAGGYLTGKVLEVDGGLISPNLDLPIPDL
ncbi:SDR family oxidoreductase [Nocardia crassostreae]|uniref:SDR family oxidoreductase n=1 Tax=Nocardia crassostreae TaxID=53428 RepID=UPI0008353E42|nr:SDR family oxidoreductase [Nocardia crassostreae]